MTTQLLRISALVAALALAGCLGPDTPEDQLKTIEEIQAKKLPMTAAQKSDLDTSVTRGREALASGDKEAASAAFGEALAILKKAEDAALFNKAD